MISKIEIFIVKNESKEVAQLICDNKDVSITFTLNNGFRQTYSDSDFYQCFARVRENNADIKFLCKGAKINVHPSSMSSQMSQGLKAYELTLGKEALLSDVVYIFDYDETNLTNDANEQRIFYKKWLEAEKTK
jgi:hypothetical protein